MAHPATVNPLADLIDLTDAELRDLSDHLHGLLGADPVDYAAVRRLLADWALTVRLRRHPDFAENASGFAEAMASEGFLP
jgi:hypothetical protein